MSYCISVQTGRTSRPGHEGPPLISLVSLPSGCFASLPKRTATLILRPEIGRRRGREEEREGEGRRGKEREGRRNGRREGGFRVRDQPAHFQRNQMQNGTFLYLWSAARPLCPWYPSTEQAASVPIRSRSMIQSIPDAVRDPPPRMRLLVAAYAISVLDTA
eukprot:3941728-Rhodomonas_salina.5